MKSKIRYLCICTLCNMICPYTKHTKIVILPCDVSNIDLYICLNDSLRS